MGFGQHGKVPSERVQKEIPWLIVSFVDEDSFAFMNGECEGVVLNANDWGFFEDDVGEGDVEGFDFGGGEANGVDLGLFGDWFWSILFVLGVKVEDL